VQLPAPISTAGPWNWWLPAWLDRALPHLDIEVGEETTATATGAEHSPSDEHANAGSEHVPVGAR